MVGRSVPSRLAGAKTVSVKSPLRFRFQGHLSPRSHIDLFFFSVRIPHVPSQPIRGTTLRVVETFHFFLLGSCAAVRLVNPATTACNGIRSLLPYITGLYSFQNRQVQRGGGISDGPPGRRGGGGAHAVISLDLLSDRHV